MAVSDGPLTLQEILREVRRIELTTKRNVTSTFSGFYHSAFRGSGMEFFDTRPYVPGDDVRHIAWNLTARSQAPQIKRFQEERELHILLAIDQSASRIFGGEKASVGRRLIQIAATLGFAALQNNDLVGAFLFTDRIEKAFLPKKGHNHALRLIREMIGFQPVGRRTSFDSLFEALHRRIRRRSVIFILSDFIAPLPSPQLMRLCSTQHELIAIRVQDPYETFLPSAGLLSVRDPESGHHRILDMGFPGLRNQLEGRVAEFRATQKQQLLRCGIETLTLSKPNRDQMELTAFFSQRKPGGRAVFHGKASTP